MIHAGGVYSELVLDGSKYFSTLDKADKEMKSFESKLGSYGKKMENLGSTLTDKVTKPVVGLVAAAGGIVAAFGWKRLTGLDAAQAQLKGLGYEVADVERISKQVSNAVQGTVMTMAEGTSTAAGALAAGVKEGEELEHYIRLVGSAAVGAGRDIDSMAMVFNRVQGSGKLMTQELNMIEDGMPGFSMAMAEHFGVSLAAFKEMVTSGKVSSQEFLVVMDDFAGGMAEAYANSWAGMVANTKSNIGILGQHLLSGVFEQSKSSIAEFLELLRSDTARDWAKDMGKNISEAFTSAVGFVKDAVTWWNNLGESTQNLILKAGALAVAAGPILTVGSKIITGITLISGVMTPLIGTIASLTAGTTAAAGGVGMLGTAAGLGATLLNPLGLAIIAAGAAGLALAKNLSEDSLPAIDLFADHTEVTAQRVETANGMIVTTTEGMTTKISEATKQAVSSFLALETDAVVSLNQLAWSGETVTEEMAANITGSFDKMAEQVQSGLDTHHADSLSMMMEFMEKSTSLTTEEQQQIIEGINTGYEGRKQIVNDGEARIQEIMALAVKEKRSITQQEHEEINGIRKQMVEVGIEVLSGSEKEHQIIYSRMKENAGQITAEQAAEVVRNSKDQADQTIDEATRQKDEIIAEIAYQRDELGTISEEQATKLIDEAKRQYEETKSKAEDMHQAVVSEAEQQAGEHAKYIDWESGEVKSKWQVMWETTKTKAKEMKDAAVENAKKSREETAREREAMKQRQKEQWDQMVANAKEKANEMKEKVIGKYEELKTAAAQKIEEKKQAIIGKWTELKDSAYTWASNMMEMFKKGISDKIESIKAKVSDLGTKIKNVLGFASPTKEGPLSDSDKWMPNFMKMLADGIAKNEEKVTKKTDDLASKISTSLSSIGEYVTNTVGIIDKEFELWVLRTEAVEESSEYLTKQLQAQKEKHEILNEQIKATEEALKKTEEKYGANSQQALELKNKLLDLKITHEGLSASINDTSKSLDGMGKSADSAYDKFINAIKAADMAVAKATQAAAKLEQIWNSTGTITSNDLDNVYNDNSYESRHGETREQTEKRLDSEHYDIAKKHAEKAIKAGKTREYGIDLTNYDSWTYDDYLKYYQARASYISAQHGHTGGFITDNGLLRFPDLQKDEVPLITKVGEMIGWPDQLADMFGKQLLKDAARSFADGSLWKSLSKLGVKGVGESDIEREQVVFTGPISVTIPAGDLAEMKSITDFFARIQQTARGVVF